MTLIKLNFTLIKEIQGRPKLLLMPPIPLPLHTVNPRSIMGEKWWDKVRHLAYKINDHHCWACGTYGERLEAHETYGINYEEHFMVLDKVIALCNKCHMFIHLGFCKTQVDVGKMKPVKYKGIVKHGSRLLTKEGLDKDYIKVRRLLSAETLHRDWDKWYLLYDGLKYYSPFKNWEAWDKHWRDLKE